MAALTPEEEQFLRDNILCVISTTKRDGSPQSTPVYYVFENGKLYISVTRPRAKTRNVRRDPRVSAVVLHPERPFPHVQITGTAEITEDDLEPLTRRIFSLFMQSLPENFTQVLTEQERQLMVVTPQRVNSTLNIRR